jgi:hypothetical protein
MLFFLCSYTERNNATINQSIICKSIDLFDVSVAATLALMATSVEFDRNKCSEFALPILCRYSFPTCKTIIEPEVDNGHLRRTLPSTKTTLDRKQTELNQRQRSGKSAATPVMRGQHLQGPLQVEHLCREDCEMFERNICRETFDFVMRQTYGG